MYVLKMAILAAGGGALLAWVWIFVVLAFNGWSVPLDAARYSEGPVELALLVMLSVAWWWAYWRLVKRGE